MPQLEKGGKWVFGWVVVGVNSIIRIPPVAFDEYGFKAGQAVLFTRGSHRSGGFGIGRKDLIRCDGRINIRCFAEGTLGENRQIAVPAEMDLALGDRLLVVRGSYLALGFLQHGPIFDLAERHPEIEVFTL